MFEGEEEIDDGFPGLTFLHRHIRNVSPMLYSRQQFEFSRDAKKFKLGPQNCLVLCLCDTAVDQPLSNLTPDRIIWWRTLSKWRIPPDEHRLMSVCITRLVSFCSIFLTRCLASSYNSLLYRRIIEQPFANWQNVPWMSVKPLPVHSLHS
jgi:hypothetical protein